MFQDMYMVLYWLQCPQSFRDTIHFVSCCETNFQEAKYFYIVHSQNGPIWRKLHI